MKRLEILAVGCALLGGLAMALPALAEEAAGGGVPREREAAAGGDKVVFKKKTLIDFSDVSIEGELRKPDGGYYGSRKRTRFNKLISVRRDFVPEIVSSTDNL